MIPLSKVLNDAGKPNTEWVQYLNLIQPSPVIAMSSNGVFVPSGLAGPIFQLALTENTTIANPTNIKPATTVVIELTEDAVGGHSITLGSQYKFPGGVVPTWATTPNAINLLTAFFDGTYLLCVGYVGFA